MSRIRAAVTGATTIAAVAAFTVVPAGAAQAAESHTTEPVCATWGPDFTDIDTKVALPGFDGALGTLTGAKVDVTGTVTGTIGVTLSPNAPIAKLIGITGTSTFTFGSSVPSLQQQLALNPLAVEYTTGSEVKQPGESLSKDLDESRSVAIEDGLVLGELSSVDSFDVTAATVTPGLQNIGSGGNLTYVQATQGAIEACVTYTYEVVPVVDPTDDPTDEPTDEPTTQAATTPAATKAAPALAYTGTERSGPLAALGAGLLLLGSSVIVLARRRRGQHS